MLESIRPALRSDGGDVEFVKYDDKRIVWLLMKGSCSGCPSSSVTLKHGIQNMLMHYVPEVRFARRGRTKSEEKRRESRESRRAAASC